MLTSYIKKAFHSLKKEQVFLLLVILLWVFFFSKNIGYIGFTRPTIKMVVQHSKGVISALDDPRNVGASRNYQIDIIKLNNGSGLNHVSPGSLGLKENFYLDFYSTIKVLKKNSYMFHVGSDDGFRLWIDNKIIGEHTKDRSYQVTICKAYLEPGIHQIKLEYFQGCCNLGLEVWYSYQENKLIPFGRSSAVLKFIKYEE